MNTYFISPPRIYHWEKMLFDREYTGDNFMDLLNPYKPNRGISGNCLSTEKRTNGAAAIFLPGVARRLAELLESDLYLVFTSIHEVMIHSTDVVYPEDLKVVLLDTVKKATPKEDYLTSSIYRYSRLTGRIYSRSKVRILEKRKSRIKIHRTNNDISFRFFLYNMLLIEIPCFNCEKTISRGYRFTYESLLAEQRGIIGKFLTACFFEFIKKIFYSKFLFLFALDVQNDLSFPHHDQAVAVGNGITHIVGDHHGCKVITVYDHICDLKNFGSCLSGQEQLCAHPEEEAEASSKWP